ncbi:MAG: hypothetical protein ABGY28_03945, partial [bacterium]
MRSSTPVAVARHTFSLMAVAAFLTVVTLLSASSVLAAQPPLLLYMAADLREADIEEPDASQEDLL